LAIIVGLISYQIPVLCTFVFSKVAIKESLSAPGKAKTAKKADKKADKKAGKNK
jgi:phosphotransferase system  glucose/maltose/N-acetylglucosamine-specific IIC component